MNENICPRCGSDKIVGHNIVCFKGMDGYYQDHNCFVCPAIWRNFYKTTLDFQQLFNDAGEIINELETE